MARLRRLLPLAWYALLAVAFTWPLARDPFGQLGALHGPGDPYLNLWILGWDLDTISRTPADVITGRVFDAQIFHPARQTLTYSDHFVVVAAMVWPLYAIAHSPVFAYNAVLVLSLLASALAMHLFAREVTGSRWGALVAGTVWGFWPYHVAHLGHIQLQATYAMPLVALALHRLVARPSWTGALALGAAGAFQAATSIYYGIIGAVGAAVSLVSLVVATGGRRTIRVATRVAVAAIVGAVLVAPFVWPYVQVQRREGFTRNLFEAARHAATPADYVSAPEANAVYGRTGWLRTNRGAEDELFPGLVVSALALYGLAVARRRGSGPLAAAATATLVAGFVLSLGPEGVRALYATLHAHVFGFQAIRAPARFAVLVAFGLATLAAIATREITAGPRGRWIGLGLLALLAVEYYPGPLAWTPAPPTTSLVSQWLATRGAPGAVIYLPMGGDIENTPAMLEALGHRRPIVNGYSGQRPPFFGGAVEALSTFPSVEACWMLHDLGVRYAVTARTVDTNAWPFVERARMREADGVERQIYELVWSPEVEARLGEPAAPVPPPPGPAPFAPGERLVYAVTWDGPAGALQAGDMTLEVDDPPAAGQHRFAITARTAPWIARFFEADDRFATTTDAALRPLLHERRIREGRRALDQRLVFDPAARSAQPQAADGQPSGPPLRLWPEARDAVSALYYVRTLALSEGRRVTIPIVESGQHSTLVLEPGAVERVAAGGATIAARRVDARLEQRVQRRQMPAITLWLEPDGAHRLIAADIHAVFGNLRLRLR
ncbi:MAG TPA: DUF3108 domain-containing protein [Vicinamibacterales bacterium]|nr:DUF3108 domain-containing protein [Vicinamibacterales bacterium]